MHATHLFRICFLVIVMKHSRLFVMLEVLYDYNQQTSGEAVANFAGFFTIQLPEITPMPSATTSVSTQSGTMFVGVSEAFVAHKHEEDRQLPCTTQGCSADEPHTCVWQCCPVSPALAAQVKLSQAQKHLLLLILSR